MSASFDTSGRVWAEWRYNTGEIRRADGPYHFSDLSPFCQGFVEAAFAGPIIVGEDAHTYNSVLQLGFSDLHPDTLARFMEDCERWLDRYPKTERTHEKGANAWRYRQEQLVERPDFPPLRLHLSPDGKVLAEEVG